MKTQSMSIREFMNGGSFTAEPKGKTKEFVRNGATIGLVLVPKIAFAQAEKADETFWDVWSVIMNGVDWLCAGILVFGGASWMMGHRGKALELIIGCCCGYLICRHALEIRDFLKGL